MMKRKSVNQLCALAALSVNASCCEAACVHLDHICTGLFMEICIREDMEVQI